VESDSGQWSPLSIQPLNNANGLFSLNDKSFGNELSSSESTLAFGLFLSQEVPLLKGSSGDVDYEVCPSGVHYEQILLNGELKDDDPLLKVKRDGTDELASAVENNDGSVICLGKFDLLRVVFLVQ